MIAVSLAFSGKEVEIVSNIDGDKIEKDPKKAWKLETACRGVACNVSTAAKSFY